MFRCVCVLAGLLTLLLNFHGISAAQEDAVAAKIGDRKITVAELDRIIGYADPERQKLFEKNPQMKESFINQIVQSIVVAQIARKSGFDKKPEVVEQMDLFRDNFLANEYLKKEVLGKIAIPEGDVKSYYDSNRDEFKMPEMVKVRHILFRADTTASEADRKKSKTEAEATLKKIQAGEDFAKLASDVSDDPGSKTRGGELGFIPRGRTVKPFEDAAFSLKKGEVSGIVETQFGYHIIKVEDKKEPSAEPFEDVKEKISRKLLQERIKSALAEFVEKAMKDSDAAVYPEALAGGTK